MLRQARAAPISRSAPRPDSEASWMTRATASPFERAGSPPRRLLVGVKGPYSASTYGSSGHPYAPQDPLAERSRQCGRRRSGFGVRRIGPRREMRPLAPPPTTAQHTAARQRREGRATKIAPRQDHSDPRRDRRGGRRVGATAKAPENGRAEDRPYCSAAGRGPDSRRAQPNAQQDARRRGNQNPRPRAARQDGRHGEEDIACRCSISKSRRGREESLAELNAAAPP